VNTELPPNVLKAKEKLLNWLTDDNMFRSNIRDDKLLFGFKCVLPLGAKRELMFVVVAPKDLSNSVIIQTSMALSPEHFSFLQQLPSDEKHDFWHKCLAQLMLRGYMTNFAMEQSDVKAVMVQKRLFYSGLTHQSFYDTVTSVHLATQYVATEVRRKTKQFMPTSPPASGDVDYESFR